MHSIALPPSAAQILQRFDRHGFSAYVVGGCVRDSLLGRQPTDWDICTDALPHQTQQLFADCRLVEAGIAHGTVTVLMEHQPFEITTFRLEGSYSDHRRPDAVHFCTDLRQDLARRDFTINAMAYHPQKGLVDPFGGQNDLKAGILRCVGQADQRFKEDALRILRAMRFLARFGFVASDDCARAMLQKRHLLQAVSKERIFAELSNLLAGEFCAGVIERFSAVLAEVLPSLSPESIAATAPALRVAPCVPSVRYALLLQGLDACAAENTLRTLKADNRLRTEVCMLLSQSGIPLICDRIEIKRRLSQLGSDQFFALLQFLSAQCTQDAAALQQLECISQLAQAILAENPCLRLDQLALGGSDLLALGLPQGKQIGQALGLLLDAVLQEQVENTPDALRCYLTQKHLL